MFCTNCGKEIIDTAKFCNFCGMQVKNTVDVPVRSAPARSVEAPGSEPAVSEENADVKITGSEEALPGTAESFSEPASGAIEAEEAEPVSESVFPRPNTIPTVGESAPVYSAQIYPSAAVPAVPVQSAVPETKPERKYTFAHIMMCLAAVAVMAIVAGVFAGLYFSVV